MKIKILSYGLLLTILFVGFGIAQVSDAGFIRSQDIMAGAYYQHWKTGSGQSANQLSFPVIYRLPVNRALSIDVINSPAFTSLSSANDNLGGIADTRLRASYVTMDDKMLITGGISLPTGKHSLSGEEINIASVLAMDALDFRVPSLGQGMDINLNIAYAREMSGFVVGGGLGYLHKGTFQPYKEADWKYTPGDEVSITVGADKNLEINGGPVRLTADIGYTLYQQDEIDGKAIFRSGNKILFDFRSMFKVGTADFLAYAQNRTRGKNQRGLGSLQSETLNSNGNQLEIGTTGTFPMNPAFRLKGILDSKIYGKNGYENNGAFVLGFGTGFEYRLSSQLTMDTRFKYLTGSLKNGNSSVSLSGFEAGAMFRIQL